MANWYVRSDGSNANTGAGNTAALACADLNGVLAKAIAAGDTIYVASGTYRQLVSMTTSGASGNVISITADVDASHFDGTVSPGEVILTGYTTNDTTTPATTNATVDLNGRSYITLDGFLIVGSGYTSNGTTIRASTSHSRGITFRRCVMVSGANAPLISYNGTSATPSDWTIDRCIFAAFPSGSTAGSCIAISPADPAQAGDFDVNFTITNSAFLFGASAVIVSGPATASGGGKPGGVRCRNVTAVGGSQTIRVTGANFSSTTFPMEVYNSWIAGTGTAFNASTSGQIVNDYCWICGSLTNVTAGANSKITTILSPLVHLGYEAIVGRAIRPFLTPMAGSPLLGFGNGGTSPSPPTVDFLNRPRPAGGASASPGIGYLERHDSITPGGATNADGGTGDCWKQAGPSDDEFQVAVDATATTIAIKQKTASYVGTNYPRVSLLANAEIGVAAQDVTDSAANTSYTTLTVGPFTPTAKGVVTLRLQNRTGDGSGVVYWDTVTVT